MLCRLGYYGARDAGVSVTEDSPSGNDFVARLCEQWEQAADLDDPEVRKVTVRIGESGCL